MTHDVCDVHKCMNTGPYYLIVYTSTCYGRITVIYVYFIVESLHIRKLGAAMKQHDEGAKPPPKLPQPTFELGPV